MAVLTGLRDDSSTGIDLLPARILKRCAEQLAKPLQSLLQRMSETKSWLSLGANIGLSPSTERKPFSQPAIIEAFTLLHNCRRVPSAYCFH